VLSVEFAVDLPEDSDDFDREEATSITGDALFEQMDVIFTFRPSTVGGVVASLKYIAEL